ncbi:hypothetical protein FEM48_Zijuj03G0004000 [Ziziphus jujuba var. spinosa]|uniref:Uncharacterized protein n=1 Tax=Ziziphus jujuba var. spinosa TaxID=714518 RepID=A0A978VM45_ZIZJJ|nr:hypothetical protein FEM48_Zijuj03G0004000 [Ziziphus jujuba var. spinosa]
MDDSELLKLLLKEEERGRIYGIKVDCNASAISHLMYADDLIISCLANPGDTTFVMPCFLAVKAWKDLYKPKEMGALGFRRFKDLNMALITKLGWKLACEEDSLWIKLMKAKYL